MERITERIRSLCKVLEGGVPPGEATVLAMRLVEDVLGISREKAMMNPSFSITTAQERKLSSHCSKLLQGIPYQYLVNEAEFLSRRYYVDERVLIPRPETEEMVKWVLKEVASPASCLDAGTGSGVIAVSLKCAFPEATVFGWDISTQALQVAKRNAKSHGVTIELEKVDLLSGMLPTRKYQLIVSNPPYIAKSSLYRYDRKLRFEPRLALAVDPRRPLLFYEALARLGHASLGSGGWIYLEINEHFGKATKSLFEQSGYVDVLLRKDFLDRPRMIRARIP